MTFSLPTTPLSVRRAPIHDARLVLPFALHGGQEVALLALRHTETKRLALALVDSECHAYAFDAWYEPSSDVWSTSRANPKQAAEDLLASAATNEDGAQLLAADSGQLIVEDHVLLH
ncbi:hypothetical protein O2W15_20030 [Modestobacter sp. VKM Ac-2979]|uniref:hypothetical protein n=1 Tax=unclassified Modestobacter TaxID=2643866 RepID=UPI0022AB7FD4|nr:MULTISPECIES: hypothetical protein [unclassified Modestobacter]MCZ2813725.1 hypothetical protein [Modestobacter sp. VKM Ac-2979]MCZ2844300.1 hypothetical protein [Modestobacter sp. VKM Ac-2980]